MVSIGGNVRPYIGDPIVFQNVNGTNPGPILASNASGMFSGGSGNIGSLTSGATLRSLSGVAVGLPLSGQTVWVVAYISSA
jgi:hypothetical protein